MVPFLINNQIHAAYGSDLAGVINHNVDNNIVAVADGTYLVKWLSVVGRNIPDMAGLKGKRVGVAKGTGGEIFWNRVVEKLKLNAADYKIIDVEAPEMVAAIERGDIDAFATWEPWPTRALMNVKDTKILQDAEGIYNNINFVYMNRTWIEKNKDTARALYPGAGRGQRSHRKDRPAAAAHGVEVPEDADRAGARADAKGRIQHDADGPRRRHHQDLGGATCNARAS